MTLYVLMVANRHADPEPHLYGDFRAALAAASEAAGELGCAPHEGSLPEGWLYLASHEDGDDSVWVVQKEIIL